MRRVMIVLGVLASGTVLSFGAAAAVFLANPNSRMVPNSVGPGALIDPGGGKVIAVPQPMPSVVPDLPAQVEGKGAIPPDGTGIAFGTLDEDSVFVTEEDLTEADLPPPSQP